jgi:hypothetical protein
VPLNLHPAQALCLVKMLSHRRLPDRQKVRCPRGATHDLVRLESHLHKIVDPPLQSTLANGMDLEQRKDSLHLTCSRCRDEGVDVLEVPAHGLRGQTAPKCNLSGSRSQVAFGKEFDGSINDREPVSVPTS